jgi:hypothetical protein
MPPNDSALTTVTDPERICWMLISSAVSDGTLELRARSRAAADLAAKTRDRDVARLLLIVSEELEEEACKLETGDPQLPEERPSRAQPPNPELGRAAAKPNRSR